MNVQQGTDKDEAYWLVKSGDRILGPFKREVIKIKLFEKEIVVIDEVTTPMRRWRYIRDEPAFAVVVEEIRKANLGSREDTELGTFTSATQTQTQAQSPIHGTEVFEDSKTPVETINDPSLIKDAEIVEEKRSNAARIAPPNSAGRSYGYSQDRRVRQDLNRSARMMWIITVVILLGAGFLFVRMQSERSSTDPGANLFKLVNEAQTARRLGDFKNAARIYNQLAEAGYHDPDMMVDMAALLLHTGDYTVSPMRLLDTVQKGSLLSTNTEIRAKLDTVRGLALLVDANRENAPTQFRKAREAFDVALKHQPGYPPAAFNRAMATFLDPAFASMKKEDVQKLAAEFETLTSSSTADPSIRSSAKLMSALTFLKTRNPFYASQAGRALETYKANNVHYWQEASFLRIYALFLENNISKAQTDLRLMLSGDPFVTSEHFVEPMVYTAPLRWAGLLPICEELYLGINVPSGPSNRLWPEPEALRQFCHFQAGHLPDAARDTLAELERKHPSDARIRSLSAFMIMSLNPEEAKAKVAGATDDQEWDLGRVLRGRLCGRTNYRCISDELPKVTTVSPEPIYFRVAVARNLLRQRDDARAAGNREGAEEFMHRARENMDLVQRISPHYLPLIGVAVETEGQ